MSAPVDVPVPVDVVAIMKEAANGIAVYRESSGKGPGIADELDRSRATVAELIERDMVWRDVLETCERWFAKHSPTAPLINGIGEAEHPMLTMIRAALALVGGAA